MFNKLGRLMFPDACSAHRYYLSAVQLSRVPRLLPTATAACRTCTVVPKNTVLALKKVRWVFYMADLGRLAQSSALV